MIRAFLLGLVIIAAATAARAPAGQASKAPPPAPFDTLHADLARRLATFERGGRWRSVDSSLLAWSCGQQLSALADLSAATGERKWLDQLVRYADAMFAHLSRNRDGFLSWRSRFYSAFRIHVVRAAGNKSPAGVEPAEAWLRRPQRWTRELLLHEVAGRSGPVDWAYHLTWQAGGKIEVKGATTGKAVSTVAVRPGDPFEPLPGLKLTLRGQPAAGDWFVLSVDRPKDFDFAVHDGVVLTPICRFIALVRADPALRPAYGKKADGYLKVMWNRSLTKPTVGGYVNTAKATRQSGNLQDWVRLSRIEPQVLAVCAKVIPKSGGLKAKAQLLRLLAKKKQR